MATAVMGLLFVPALLADTKSEPALGVDRSAMDLAVRPQDDLFRYVNGTWFVQAPFPAEYPSAGNFIMLLEKAQDDVHAILVEAAAAGVAAPPQQQLGDLYASFMDEELVESLGVAPVAPLFAEIHALDGPAAVAGFLGRARGLGVDAPLGIDVDPDARHSTHNIVYVSQSGLGLPNRDYYLREDATYAEFRRKYVAYVAQLMTLAGLTDAASRAERVLELETALARAQWTPVQNRDPVATYNRHDPGSAARLAPELDWPAFLSGADLPPGDFVIRQPDYTTAVGRALHERPLAVWQDYLVARVLDAYAPLLTQAFVDAHFDLNSRTLRGTETLRPRWKRAVSEVNDAMGEAVGSIYVGRHFPPAAKQRMDELVRNLLAEFADGIGRLDWMSAATQVEARAKLAQMRVKIGYPERWRSYAGLEIRRDDLVGNLMRARSFEWAWQRARAGQPKDPDEWLMTPQTINAYYMPTNNEIVFPAAILQPPFFDLQADDAVNYGAIGAVIGHEISHGFDDKGRQFDGAGNLRDWWTPEDDARFRERAAGLVRQYAGFEVLPGVTLNGELTLGENIGDLSGLTVAYRAWQRSLGGTTPPEIDGFTGGQRFFLGFAQAWRGKWREAMLRERVLTDPHSPPEFRANGVVANMDEFYQAFGLRAGDRLWRPASERVRIW